MIKREEHERLKRKRLEQKAHPIKEDPHVKADAAEQNESLIMPDAPTVPVMKSEDFSSTNVCFEALNEMIAERFTDLSRVVNRYLTSVEQAKKFGDLPVGEADYFLDLYTRAFRFAASLDVDLEMLREILGEKYADFSEKLAEDMKVCAAEYDGMICIVLPLPDKYLAGSHHKQQHPHTSILRNLLEDCLRFAKESSLYLRPINIYFLFNYDKKTFPCDHDKLRVSGWIDEITEALGIDDNGITCHTHYASIRENRLMPMRTYVCVTSRDVQPMTPGKIVDFFLEHFTLFREVPPQATDKST